MHVEDPNQNTNQTTHSLRVKTKQQKDLAKAVQEYQAAKFEAEALLKNLNKDSPSSQSSQSSQTSESQASSMQPSLAETDYVYTIEN